MMKTFYSNMVRNYMFIWLHTRYEPWKVTDYMSDRWWFVLFFVGGTRLKLKNIVKLIITLACSVLILDFCTQQSGKSETSLTGIYTFKRSRIGKVRNFLVKLKIAKMMQDSLSKLGMRMLSTAYLILQKFCILLGNFIQNYQ